jgi:hypothetical protein
MYSHGAGRNVTLLMEHLLNDLQFGLMLFLLATGLTLAAGAGFDPAERRTGPAPWTG